MRYRIVSKPDDRYAIWDIDEQRFERDDLSEEAMLAFMVLQDVFIMDKGWRDRLERKKRGEIVSCFTSAGYEFLKNVERENKENK